MARPLPLTPSRKGRGDCFARVPPPLAGGGRGRGQQVITTREALRLGAVLLREAGIDNPRLEARLLLGHATGLEQAALLADPMAPVPTDPYAALLARRAAHEPLAFILGTREFWSLPFEVSPATLIPRPESESLIEAALALFPDRSAVRRILDLGTGTGCLILAALDEFPGAFGVGVDRAPQAAALARRNAVRLGLARRAEFLAGDWAGAIGGCFEIVLCNPPYIESGDIAALMPEISRHEPLGALDGGADGLDAYRRLLPELPRLLAPAGAGLLEMGQGQTDALMALAAGVGLTTSTVLDLAGIPRVLVCRARR